MVNYNQIKITKNFLEFCNEKGEKCKTSWEPSVAEFRDQVANIEFSRFYLSIGGKEMRNDKLENYQIPAVVHTYYQLFAENNIVPTVEDVCNAYIGKYVNIFRDGKRGVLHKQYKPGGQDLVFKLDELRARICRAYNSFHRELDLLIQLIEAYGEEFNFYYSFNDDYFKGIDIVVYDKKDTRFNIATYYSSDASKAYKSLKDTVRHIPKSRQINVLAYFDGDDKNVVNIGDAKLYDESAVKYVYAHLTDEICE